MGTTEKQVKHRTQLQPIRFMVWWVIASAMGGYIASQLGITIWLLGLGSYAHPISKDLAIYATVIAVWAGFGLFVGAVQSLLVRSYVGWLGDRWVPLSAIGGGIGGAACLLVPAGVYLWAVLYALFLSSVQWLSLRERVPSGWAWIVGNIAAGFTFSLAFIWDVEMVAYVALMLLSGTITGGTLLWLFWRAWNLSDNASRVISFESEESSLDADEFPKLKRSEKRKRTEAMTWWQVWTLVFTRPSLYTFETILNDPNARARRALVWVALTWTLSDIVTDPSILAGNPLLLDTALWLAVVAGLSILFTVIWAGILHLIAKLFGGHGTFSAMVYALGAIIAPGLLLDGALRITPYFPGLWQLIAAFGIYRWILDGLAFNAVYGFRRAWLPVIWAIAGVLWMVVFP